MAGVKCSRGCDVNGGMGTLLRTIFAGVLIALVIVSGCDAGVGGARPVKGSGVVVEEKRQASGFTQVRVSGVGEVTIERAEAESLAVEAEDNILPLLETTVRYDALHLGAQEGASIRPTRPIRYRVGVKELTGVGVSGSADVQASSIQAGRLVVRISGSGNVRLGGSADEVDVQITGSGDCDAAGLRCKSAKVVISGSGGATVDAAEKLDVTITGSGSVRYAGNPAVQQRVTGSGSVSQR